MRPTHNSVGPNLVPFIVTLVLLSVSVGAVWLASSTQSSLENYRSPYGSASEPAATVGSPLVSLTRHVVVVVVDGLREDVSHEMPFLESLRRNGAWTSLTVDQPSYSKPNYATIMTGTPVEVHGVTLNAHLGPVATDNIFRRTHAGGLRSAVIGHEWWGELAGNQIDFPYLYPDAATATAGYDQKAFADTLRSFARDQADLTLVHLCAVDTAGHAAGGRSQQYLAAARRDDGYLRRIVAGMDLSQDTLVVLADHGHLGRNSGGHSGHGGSEAEVTTVPFVMAGKSVRPGRLEPGQAEDTALTVAALLGISPPVEATGRVRWEALNANESDRAAFAVARVRAGVEGAKAYLGALSGRRAGEIDAGVRDAVDSVNAAAAAYAAGRYSDAIAKADTGMADLLRHEAQARAFRLWVARSARLPLGLLSLVGLFLLTGVGGRRRMAQAFAVGAIFVAFDYLAYRYLFDYALSLSAVPGTGLFDVLRLFGLPEYLALTLVLVPYFLIRKRGKPGMTAAFDATMLGVGLYLPLILVAVAGYIWNGNRVTHFLPSFDLGYLQLGSLLQLGWLLPVALFLPSFAAAFCTGNPETSEPGELQNDTPATRHGGLARGIRSRRHE